MSKEHVAQLWNKYKHYSEMHESQYLESSSIANEKKQIRNKVNIIDAKKLNELNESNNSLSKQLRKCEASCNSIDNESKTDKSVLTFIQHMLGEYNEYNPVTNTTNVSTIGDAINIEIDRELTNKVNQTNI